MIPKKPVPDLIRDGNRLSDKIMRKEDLRISMPPVAPQRFIPLDRVNAS
jgi:hypothetical protein